MSFAVRLVRTAGRLPHGLRLLLLVVLTPGLVFAPPEVPRQGQLESTTATTTTALPTGQGLDALSLRPGRDPWEPNDDLAHAPLVAVDQPIHATLGCPQPVTGCVPGDQDVYRWMSTPGTCSTISIVPQALAVPLVVLDLAGHTVAGNASGSDGELRPSVMWCTPAAEAAAEMAVRVGPLGTGELHRSLKRTCCALP